MNLGSYRPANDHAIRTASEQSLQIFSLPLSLYQPMLHFLLVACEKAAP